jgi:hypothetical protein
MRHRNNIANNFTQPPIIEPGGGGGIGVCGPDQLSTLLHETYVSKLSSNVCVCTHWH